MTRITPVMSYWNCIFIHGFIQSHISLFTLQFPKTPIFPISLKTLLMDTLKIGVCYLSVCVTILLFEVMKYRTTVVPSANITHIISPYPYILPTALYSLALSIYLFAICSYTFRNRIVFDRGEALVP